jgi:flagellar motor protein MotB
MRCARTALLPGLVLTLFAVGCADRIEPGTAPAPRPAAAEPQRPARPTPTIASNGARDATATELQQELSTAVRQLEAARTENASLRDQLQKARAANTSLVSAMEQEASKPLTRPQAPPAALPGDIDAALQSFAQKNAGRVTYDRSHSGVSLANDKLFAAGQDGISREGRALLDEFAGIASRTSPGEFEIVIVGHTDNSPITGGGQARHASNWHLSVHRAIAVKDVLVSAGIPESRIGVMGYSSFRSLGGDKALDRRVEIYIAPKGAVSARAPIRP